MDKRMGNTKQLFMKKALELFAERGYRAVSVAQIANEVGCTAPALYKHFQSKQALFDAIVQESESGFEENTEKMRISYEKYSSERKELVEMTEEEQIETIQKVFLHTVKNEWVKAFRKLLVVEQFNMPELAEIYNNRYVMTQIKQHETFFKVLKEEGVLKPECDPYILAIEYVAPITAMISVCDRDESQIDWALDVLEKHVKEFNKFHKQASSIA